MRRPSHVRGTLLGGVIRGAAQAVTALGLGGVLFTLALEALP
jgi:hypothetical protein